MVRQLTVISREYAHLHQPSEFTLTARVKLRGKGGCVADNRFQTQLRDPQKTGHFFRSSYLPGKSVSSFTGGHGVHVGRERHARHSWELGLRGFGLFTAGWPGPSCRVSGGLFWADIVGSLAAPRPSFYVRLGGQRNFTWHGPGLVASGFKPGTVP